MTDIVELTIPVTADLLVLARLTAATVASRADFDIEEIEDLRLAVDELCISMIHGVEEGRLGLQFSRDEDEIKVSCRYLGELRTAPSPSEGSLDGLSGQILDALVDEHGDSTEDGERRAWLLKRRARQSG
jgi:anti-sigma regulatory factor (Ser/Thr protein kinase)